MHFCTEGVLFRAFVNRFFSSFGDYLSWSNKLVGRVPQYPGEM